MIILLNSSRFDAVIYKEDNVQGDRDVKDYINDNALMQLLGIGTDQRTNT